MTTTPVAAAAQPAGNQQPPLPPPPDASGPAPPLPADTAEPGQAAAQPPPPLPDAPLPPQGEGKGGSQPPPLPGEEPSAVQAGTAADGPPPLPDEDEEDPLVVAQREREAAEKAKEAAAVEIPPYDEEALKEFYTDLRDAEREGEVNRVLAAFKLNPFEQMNLRFDATSEEVRRQYRKISLMVHPDKCSHPRAKDAFEVVGAAQKDLLDEEQRKRLDFLLTFAKDEVRKDWKKAAKGDAAVRLATLMNEEGKEGVAAAFEQTDEFHEAWKLKARDVLARAEWRKRKLTKRIGEEEERAKAEYKEEREAAKKLVKHEKAWEKTRDERVGSWRDFVQKKPKKTAAGALKPPKMKESDQERRYIQRPVGEQHRPPPPKHAGPRREERD